MPDRFDLRLERALSTALPSRLESAGARPAAVLVPLVAAPDPFLIFTVRADTLPSHQGQISFPGGSLGPGETPSAAALREAHEEIGLEPDQVRVLGELDTFPTFVSGYLVTPIVGWIASLPSLNPNPDEVAAVLQVPLGELTEDIRAEPGFEHGGRVYPTEAWGWRDH
ncbi:MAG: CoA pyrophosphatase, partial [Actinomycetota bacterium]